VTNFYNWQKILFERAAQLFDREPNAASVRRQEAAAEKKVEALEAKLLQKNEVIAELLKEHVQLKKPRGPLKSTLGPPRHPRSDRRLCEPLDSSHGQKGIHEERDRKLEEARRTRADRRRQEISSTPRKASRQPPDREVSSSVSQEDRALLGSKPSV
jgi:hypothetical protein